MFRTFGLFDTGHFATFLNVSPPDEKIQTFRQVTEVANHLGIETSKDAKMSGSKLCKGHLVV